MQTEKKKKIKKNDRIEGQIDSCEILVLIAARGS